MAPGNKTWKQFLQYIKIKEENVKYYYFIVK